MTTAERWKKKKEGSDAVDTNENSEKIFKLTELANELLTRTGNMDIYQESYDCIKKKVIFQQIFVFSFNMAYDNQRILFFVTFHKPISYF